MPLVSTRDVTRPSIIKLLVNPAYIADRGPVLLGVFTHRIVVVTFHCRTIGANTVNAIW